MKPLSSLHYRNNLHFIGDVHPFYCNKSKEWFLYYLQPGGQFNSLLVKSKNLFQWEECPLTFQGVPRAKYFVVAILKHSKVLYSWYGQQFVHVCSKSKDGVAWEADPSLDIKVNRAISGFGERDPYVVFDKQKKCFYALALAYLNGVSDCAITLKKTQSSNLHQWEANTSVALRFPNTDQWTSGEPECPQLMKIKRRWYIFASLARRTVHHVGGLSYWIGDLDKSPDEIDWSSKPKHTLTSEDLCAAQLVQKNQSFYLMGWIPQDYHGSEWGGNVNLPLIVRALPDGELTTAFAASFFKSFERKPIASASEVTRFKTKLSQDSINQIKATLGIQEKTTFSFSQNDLSAIDVCLDPQKSKVTIAMADPLYECASLDIPNTIFSQTLDIEIFTERDIVEINVNKAYTLHARVGRLITNDLLTTHSPMIQKIEVFKLGIKSRKAPK